MKLVIVESPSKAKTINKYLGSSYKVVASYGHIKQLVSKSGSVIPEENFNMIWEDTVQSKKHLSEIKTLAKTADEIYLATDPDREGEAISWHLKNFLVEKKLIKKDVPVKRVIFNAITKDTILEAFKNSREVDDKLVNAYLARIALDYLVGFNISPILWKKMPGTRSAGRVQSVALRLICEREAEIQDFIPREFWDISLDMLTPAKESLKAKLSVYDGKKLDKFDIKNGEEAEAIKLNLEKSKSYEVKDIINKKIQKSPFAPFTTSTLQQDAFNKLSFSAKSTMSIAQKLYEGIKLGDENVGLITYMRTDATQIIPSFIEEIRGFVAKEYGEKYLYKTTRVYKTKAKNAQEAHEAIRPTSIKNTPKSVKPYLSDGEFALYNLIWKRSIASQMENALYNSQTLEIHNDKNSIFKASGSILEFEGFYKVYERFAEDDESENKLPKVPLNTLLDCEKINLFQHFTEAPPRYSEATLVKNMEELGIGRPSTYASIINILQERDYCQITNKRFYPKDRGIILNTFLKEFFTNYVDYNFTADLEKSLDEVSSGEQNWTKLLDNFWKSFHENVEKVEALSSQVVFDALNKTLAKKFIGEDLSCPKCENGTLTIKRSKYGPFVACSNYPDCTYTKEFSNEAATDSSDQKAEDSNNKIITVNASNQNILLKKGPYGHYIEIEGSNPIKKVAIPKNINPSNITKEEALFLSEIPKKITPSITLGIGRFGPYLKEGSSFYSVKEDIFSITEEKAKQIIEVSIKKKNGINLGKYPKSKKDILLKFGKYGIYLEYDGKNIKIPKEYKTYKEELPLDIAIKIIEIS